MALVALATICRKMSLNFTLLTKLHRAILAVGLFGLHDSSTKRMAGSEFRPNAGGALVPKIFTTLYSQTAATGWHGPLKSVYWHEPFTAELQIRDGLCSPI